MDDRDLIAPGEQEDELAAQASEGEYEPEGPNENWLVSYADLMTLLFGFFAMLYLTQALKPPAPDSPQAPAKQEQAQEAKEQPETPEPSVPKPEPPPISHGVPELPPMPAAPEAGGNRGFHVLDFLPPMFLLAAGIVIFGYVALFLLGLRRHRIIVDPVTGAAAVRRVPLIQMASAARRPLTPEQLALKAKEEEIMRLDEADELVEVEEAHGAAAHMTDERWLISYADLMTLLFGFYAMLYLMGPNFEAVKSSMDQAFSRADEAPVPLRPIQVPNVPPLPLPAAPPVPVATAPAAPPATVAETNTEATTAPETVAQTQTAVQTETQTVAETPVALKPRPTPTREELEKMEEERKAALKERLAQRAQELAAAEAEARAYGQAGGRSGGAGGTTTAGDGKGSSMTKGKGGKGVGGGKGSGVGAGTSAAVGSAICSEGALTPYSPTCWGSGFFGCLTTGQISSTGGQNGEGGALEFYCMGGRTRVCLTYEYCPWRMGPPFSREDYPNGFPESSASPASMECSPSGLAVRPGGFGFMAECRDRPMCNFARLECDGSGKLSVR